MSILPPPTITPQSIERFERNVDKSGECWVWTAARNSSGYGTFKFGRTKYLAHRVAYFMHTGEYPTMLVCHQCDNPKCVNPDHLFHGSHLDNLHDRNAKGRSHGYAPHNTKLSPNDVDQIRNQYVDFIESVASSLGVETSTIHRVVAGNSWRRPPK